MKAGDVYYEWIPADTYTFGTLDFATNETEWQEEHTMNGYWIKRVVPDFTPPYHYTLPNGVEVTDNSSPHIDKICFDRTIKYLTKNHLIRWEWELN